MDTPLAEVQDYLIAREEMLEAERKKSPPKE